MKSRIYPIILFSLLVLSSCSTSEVPIEQLPIVQPTEQITYEKDVKNIISNSCATTNCHDDVSPAAGLALTNFDRVRNAAENGNLFGRINNSANPMPPSGLLPTSTRNIISQWRADGYLEE
ncbi:hypothetical protein [Tenacibaculum jejuense]|uniref:WD40 repeat protein n=1 Tax=Tenacibaculum jejuense TaxID=584609 RepID=A0A238U5P8_9FLAO|nr:hypothetical protein [Tenacibaculum jejuense]SNR14326.1 WD40 repeat protein [Tenacibaculum jejuense]